MTRSAAAPATSAVNFGLLFLRVVVGFTFAMYGWQKIDSGIPAVATSLGSFDLPMPEVLAPFQTGLEFAGGIALALGFLTRPLAVLLAITMVVALVLVHLPHGFFDADGGVQLLTLLIGTSLTLAFTGPGRFSVDAFLFARRGTRVLGV